MESSIIDELPKTELSRDKHLHVQLQVASSVL